MKITFEIDSDKLIDILGYLKENINLKVNMAYENAMKESQCIESVLKRNLCNEMPSRPAKILAEHNINTFGDLVKIENPSSLLDFPGMWKRSYEQICEVVKNYGLHFGMK